MHHDTYIAYNEHLNLFKIGKSSTPGRRVNSFIYGNIRSFLIMTFNKDIEIKIHQNFKHKRVNGEWFKLSDNDLKTIKDTFSMYGLKEFVPIENKVIKVPKLCFVENDKIYKLIYYYGKVGLADKMNMNYRTLRKRIEENSFSIDEMEKLNELYNEIPILPSES